ncbi:MAG: hypothetical protein JNK22_15050 [Rhodocyclaceae bacterium]|nr:hypothetical protein [Rhodocyclaceae bacterium]
MIAGMADLVSAVQRNCHIADARHARGMTLCTYLLEMREFYRWEHDLPLGVPPPREDVGRWISEREAYWEEIEEADFADLPLAGRRVPPFEAARANEDLLPAGLVYGAGIGRFGKPHFFLARLERREGEAGGDGPQVLVCGCEYARDLNALPAALQGDTVIVRREALRQWLWEKAEAWGVKQREGPMAAALASYGFGAGGTADAQALERMTDAETDTLILHERGEWQVGRVLGPDWERMLAGLGNLRAELLARAVRDLWADCLATLPALLARERAGALHFWFANLEGMRRELAPDLVAAYAAWAGGDAAPLRDAAAAGAAHWQAMARRLLASHLAAPEGAAGELEALSFRLPELAR